MNGTPASDPAYGFTAAGNPVHAKTADHHPANSAYQRFNKRLATLITANVGTMTCFWSFCALAFVSFYAAISSGNLIIIVAWIAQTFFQLVLLPALMVGQNLQSEAADARAAKTFDDVEVVLDRLDTHTQGGLETLLTTLITKSDAETAAIVSLQEMIVALAEEVRPGFIATLQQPRDARPDLRKQATAEYPEFKSHN